MKKRPKKVDNLIEVVSNAIETQKIRYSVHALERMAERGIIDSEVLYILKNGFHEKRKDDFDLNLGWKYSIRGQTLDERDLRIVISVLGDVIVVTVIDKEAL
jgi:hypothetical protein